MCGTAGNTQPVLEHAFTNAAFVVGLKTKLL
jgi:hypothetical protein